MLETHKSFVNTWECDENSHLNVQFYFERFEEADAHFRLIARLDRAATGPRLERHVRYHAEARAGGLQAVRSGLHGADATSLVVLHVLYETGSDRISATALDRYQPPAPIDPSILARIPAAYEDYLPAARPRSFTAPPPSTGIGPEELFAAGGFTTARGLVKPAHCTADGVIEDRHVIAAMSNAASHVWETAPTTRAWLEEHNYGRVAVEMRLVYGPPLKCGALTHVMSNWLGAGRTTMQFRHHLFDAASETCHAIVESSGLIMDLARRKAVRLPEEFRATIEKMARH
jgi:acyl-CoA thioester hydrolase